MEDRPIKIPKNLEECFTELEDMLDPKDVFAIKNGKWEDGDEKDEHGYYNNMFFGHWLHMQLGMWLRNNWGLWTGGQLRDWFNEKGIWHADDMSGIILESFRRRLNLQPILLESQIEHYQKFWDDRGVDVKAEALKAREASGS